MKKRQRKRKSWWFPDRCLHVVSGIGIEQQLSSPFPFPSALPMMCCLLNCTFTKYCPAPPVCPS